jgi:hypothetical protein
VFYYNYFKIPFAGHQWLTSIIIGTWEAEIRRIEIRDQQRKIVHDPTISKIIRAKMDWRYVSGRTAPAL